MIAASRVAIVGSLLALLVGSTFGLAMGVGWIGMQWRPAHAHLQSLGFVALMIQGIAYHVLPRFRGVPMQRPRLALAQVIATIAGVTFMAAGWGLVLGPAWFAFAGTVAWFGNVLFVAIALEIVLRSPARPARGPMGR